ncbi:unnamed protein product [Calypogeia fissa]
MHLRPALRAFSESVSPLQCNTSTLFISTRSVRNVFHRLPTTVPNLCFPNSVTETCQLCHAIVSGSFKSRRGVRNAFLSPSSLPSSVWTMSLSSSPSADIVQSSDSSLNPVLVEEVCATGPESSREDVIVQYIVIRKDLVEGLNWPLGSVISQGCHAAVAAIWLHKDDPVTQQYCAPDNLDNMHKVTLEVKGETQLRNLAQKLESGRIVHKLWIEQPENYATCLATKPYLKNEVASYFKKLKLCK